MYLDCHGGVIIKVKIKTILTNKSINTEEKVETKGLKNKNVVTYRDNETFYKVTIHNNSVELTRDNDNFMHKFIFSLDNKTNTEYYIKEYKTTLTIPIVTNKLIIRENEIEIHYIICDNQYEYIYILEMSEN